MRILKLALISFVFLFGLILLISLLIPSHIRLSRATNLPNDRRRIFTLLKNDTGWHPAYRDTASARGLQNIEKKVTEETDSTFIVRLQQKGRKPVISGWQLYGTPSADSLTLQWYMDFDLGWKPWNKFSSLFFESTYGSLMETGLNSLKKQMLP